MTFIDTLGSTPRLVIEPEHLHCAVSGLVERYPDLSAAVLHPAPADATHVLVLHSDPNRAPPSGGAPVPVALDLIETRLGEAGCALMHGPYPADADLAVLFPDAGSVFLRRAYTDRHDPLLLAVAVDGMNAEFASRYGAYLLIERLRHRIDEHFQQSRIQEFTRRLEMQIQEVSTIKEKLLPTTSHEVAGVKYAAHYQPCPGGGGDYYEVSDLRATRERLTGEPDPTYWGVIIADVSGHGPGAAVEVAMLDSILRTYPGQRDFHPGLVLNYCNRHMFTRQLRGGYITVFIANYDARTRELQYACAGHPGAIIKCGDTGRACRTLDEVTDIPLGVETEHEWSSAATTLEPEDMLVLFTDGATEAESLTEEQFGIEGMRQAIEASRARDPDALLKDIVDALNHHVGTGRFVDDCTIVVLKPQTANGAGL